MPPSSLTPACRLFRLRTQADSDAFATCSALCCIRDSLDQIAAERRAAALRSIMEHIRTNANVVKADLKNAKDQVLESIRQYLARSVDTEVTLFRMKESPTKTAILATLLQPVRDAKEMFCTVSSQGPLRLGYQESYHPISHAASVHPLIHRRSQGSGRQCGRSGEEGRPSNEL